MLKKQLPILLVVFSVGCAGIPRPTGDICVNDVPRLKQYCFEMEKDFDEQGELIPGTEPKEKVYPDEKVFLDALDKNTTFDPWAWKEVVIYLQALRRECTRDRGISSETQDHQATEH